MSLHCPLWSEPVSSLCLNVFGFWLSQVFLSVWIFFFFFLAWSKALPECRRIHTHTHSHTEPQVIFILAHGRWESRKNNQVGLHILFSQTSSKLSPSPSSRVLWASSNRQHQSHFIQPARLSLPLFPGKCLTSPPKPQSKLKRGLCTYVAWSQLIVWAAGWTWSWSKNRWAHRGDQALQRDNWVTVESQYLFSRELSLEIHKYHIECAA